MVTVVFRDNQNYTDARGLWQWDYGQILRIQGLTLPSAVEIHFALQATGGEAVTRIGITKDGVTDVIIPDSMLEGGNRTVNYYIYAFIYLTDETSGETVKRIQLHVATRPKPEGYSGDDTTTMAAIVESVNEIASGKADGLDYRNSILRLLSGETEIARVAITGNAGGSAREIELQNNDEYIQWRYAGEESWTDLIALADLKGNQGEQGPEGQPGKDGADGITPHIGDNGNWWIGTTDTGVSATVKQETGAGFEVDDTLSVSGAAADAAVVGQKFSQLSGEIAAITGISLIEPAEDDIPKVFFSAAIPQTKDDVVTAFRYISKTQDISGYAEFKAQGNSSMNYAKKNMTVKMYSDEALEEKLKVDFKGWGKQRKHVYKANWIDLTHARNIVSARIWADVVKSRSNYAELPEELRTSPNQGAIDGFPIKVYSQGIYQGRYTLNIPKDAWMANMDDSLDEHCILCGEGYNSGCFRSASMGEWTDEVHDTRPTLITNRWLEVINFVMKSTDEEFKANLGNYFFVDSLIDYFIFGIVSCGLDAFGKNQLYFTYDGQRWIASMYDMDSTWGLYWNGASFVSASYSRQEFEDFVDNREGNLLYIRLAELFCERIQERYTELKQSVLSIPNIINHFERFTDITPLDLAKEDYASTTGSGKFTGIPSQSTNNIQQIRKFVVDRYVYCDEYFDSLTPIEPVPATGITLDKTILTFTDSAAQVIAATVEPENTTDTVVWTSNDENIAKVASGVVTPIANGSCTITATAGSVSATCEVSINMEMTPYLQNDGVAYINLGINSADGYSYEICMQDEKILSAGDGGENGEQIYFGNRFNNFKSAGFNYIAWTLKGTHCGFTSLGNTEKHTYKVDVNNLYLDGVSDGTANWGTSANHPSMLLFGANYINGASGFYPAQLTRVIKFYHLRIWDSNNELIHSYVPALKDGVACVYDEVTDEYLYNAAESGGFTYGVD